MFLYFILHTDSPKYFLFQSDENLNVARRDIVICKTKHGDKHGIVGCFLETDTYEAEIIAKACGAYWPLAKILRKYEKPVVTSVDEIPQWLLNKIRAEERAAIMELIEPRKLPFDL